MTALMAWPRFHSARAEPQGAKQMAAFRRRQQREQCLTSKAGEIHGISLQEYTADVVVCKVCVKIRYTTCGDHEFFSLR